MRPSREFLDWLQINDDTVFGRAFFMLRVAGAFSALALRFANLATDDEEMGRQLQIRLRLANGDQSLPDVLYVRYWHRLVCPVAVEA